MRISRQFVLAAMGLSLGSALWAAPPVSSDLPKTTSLSNPFPQNITGGVMVSGSASSFATGNGNGGQTMSKAQVQMQFGGLPQLGNSPKGTVSSDLPALPGLPINLMPINAEQFGNAAVANPADMKPRATATINSGEDKITTGADDQYSTVIKVKPNGQITMIVVTMATMDVRRVQVKNVEELQKKDKLAFAEYQKYTEAE